MMETADEDEMRLDAVPNNITAQGMRRRSHGPAEELRLPSTPRTRGGEPKKKNEARAAAPAGTGVGGLTMDQGAPRR